MREIIYTLYVDKIFSPSLVCSLVCVLLCVLCSCAGLGVAVLSCSGMDSSPVDFFPVVAVDFHWAFLWTRG